MSQNVLITLIKPTKKMRPLANSTFVISGQRNVLRKSTRQTMIHRPKLMCHHSDLKIEDLINMHVRRTNSVPDSVSDLD